MKDLKAPENILYEVTIITGTEEALNVKLFVTEIKSDVFMCTDVITGCFCFAKMKREKKKKRDKLDSLLECYLKLRS